MPADLTSEQLPQSIIDAIEQQVAKAYSDRLALAGVQELSQISSNIGLVYAGEIRLGNGVFPGSGFSGLRLAYPESILTYNSQTWNLAGIANDIFQIGIRASDGILIAGNNEAALDSAGLKLKADGAAGVGFYVDIADSESEKLASIRYSTTFNTLNFSAWEASGNIKWIISSDDAMFNPTLHFYQLSSDGHQYLEWDSADFGSMIIRMIDAVHIVGKEQAGHTDLTETFFNGLGFDLDFRIESENNSNMFFLDGSTDRIGIGHNTPLADFDINGDLQIRGFTDLLEATAPGTPASGYGRFYVKTDSLPYFKDDGGVEFGLTGGGGGGGIKIIQPMPPATLAATIDYRPGDSTPAEQFQVWDFDPSTVEYMDFKCFAESYADGGFTVTLPWSADGTATGNVIWSAAFRRIEDDVDDLDVSHTYDYNDVTDAAPTVDGEVVYPTITFTDGADSDNVAEGDMFILRVRRRADQGGDTMDSNDAELHLPNIKET